MDMLRGKGMTDIVTKAYENSGEPELVRKAVRESCIKEEGHNQRDCSSDPCQAKLQEGRYAYYVKLGVYTTTHKPTYRTTHCYFITNFLYSKYSNPHE